MWLVLPAAAVIFTVNVPTGADTGTDSVNVEEALPPGAGVTVAGAKDAATPDGSPVRLRLVAPLKPPRLPTMTVAALLLPLAADRWIEPGDTLSVKSGDDPLTVRLSAPVWLRLPDVPPIVSVKLPALAEEDTASVSVDDALPPADGVTLGGPNDAVTPLGRPEMLRLVAPLKPFRLLTVTTALPLLFGAIVIEPGATLSPKSGIGWGLMVSVSVAL